MKKKISYDDLMCVCELADLFLSSNSRASSKMWQEEKEVVRDFKWFLLQCEATSFTIEETK